MRVGAVVVNALLIFPVILTLCQCVTPNEEKYSRFHRLLFASSLFYYSLDSGYSATSFNCGIGFLATSFQIDRYYTGRPCLVRSYSVRWSSNDRAGCHVRGIIRPRPSTEIPPRRSRNSVSLSNLMGPPCPTTAASSRVCNASNSVSS